MNVTLLTLCLLSIWSTRWPVGYAPVAALGVLSLEMQALSATGGGWSLRAMAVCHGLLLAALVSQRSRRMALVSHGRSLWNLVAAAVAYLRSPQRRPARTVLLVLMGLLMLRTVFFVAEAADPYHLVRVSQIATSGTLGPVPVEDWKINAFGYLHELALADLIPTAAWQPWLSLQGPVLVAVYFLIIVHYSRRMSASVPWQGVLLICVMPVVFHQGVLIKNDLVTAILVLPVLVILRDHRLERKFQTPFTAGGLTGLALSVKTTAFPAAIALALFLPWKPFRLAIGTRIAAVSGVMAGAVAGGLAYIATHNIATYGTVVGPITRDGNVNETAGAAALSLLRFIISWFDLGLSGRIVWPGRGGWGGTFGWALAWSLCILLVRCRGSREARRALALTLVSLVPLGVLYPDADLAHRMAIAPATFATLVAVTLEAERGGSRQWMSAVSALLVVLAAVALVTRSAIAYLGQVEYLRPMSMARVLEPAPGYLASKLPWRLREAHARLGRAVRVCTIMQENALATHGYRFDSVVITEATVRGSRLVWRPDVLAGCDAVVIGPNTYPDPDPESAAALERCGNDHRPVAGPATDVRVLTCGPM